MKIIEMELGKKYKRTKEPVLYYGREVGLIPADAENLFTCRVSPGNFYLSLSINDEGFPWEMCSSGHKHSIYHLNGSDVGSEANYYYEDY